jgi:N-acetylglucosamine-6-phosphate deacetylase
MTTTRKGFIDVQNNGWMGTSFTEPGLTLARVRDITLDLLSRGTLAYCPTVITGDPAVYKDNLRVLAEAMKDPEIGPHLLGIHLEGPFISTEPGAVGAHPKAYVQNPDVRAFEQYQQWAGGGIRILTLAPERPGADALIRCAVKQGVVVSIGHHLASDPEMELAVKAGASLSTHLGNGCPNMIPRHENPLWWQLACDALSGLFITDGHHLPADFIKVALRAKTLDRFIVTSDVSPLAGMPPGRYNVFAGLTVVIGENRKIYSEQSQSLAGSHATMMECMNYLAGLALLDEKGLWQVGYDNPARLLNLDPKRLKSLKGPDVRFEDGRFVLA